VLRVERTGFKAFVQDGLQLGPEQATVAMPVVLAVGDMTAELMVTSTRIETELKDTPASLSIITSDDITNKGARYVGDELLGQPGVFVTRADEGTYTSVTIRGVPEVHHNDTFLALIDGIPLVTSNDEVNLEQIPLDIVERVEVVRGPTSALYGRGGVAGAINYITRTPSAGRREAAGELTYGSYNYVKPRIAFGSPLGARNSIFTSAYYEAKEGWRDRTERHAGSVFVKDQWLASNHWVTNGYFSLARYKQGVASHVPYRADGSLVELPGGRRANYNIDDSRYDNTTTMAAVSVERMLSDRSFLRTRFQYRYWAPHFVGGFNEGIDEEAKLFFWNGFDGHAYDHNVFVEPQFNWRSDKVKLVAGATYERVRASFTEDWTGQFGFDSNTFRFSFYEQFRSYETGELVNRDAWITDRLLVARSRGRVGSAYGQAQIDLTPQVFATVGARYENYARTVVYDPVTVAGEPQPGETVEDDNHRLSPKVSLSFRPTTAVTGYVSYSEGFSPAFGAVFNFRNRSTNLKPEVSRNYEAGIRADVQDRMYISATVFQLDRRDLLQDIIDGTGIRTINAGRQRVRGLEIESRLRLDARTRVSASYSFTDSVWLENRFFLNLFGFPEEIDYSGKKVKAIPPHLATFAVTHTLRNGISVSAGVDAASRSFIDGQNTIKKGGYALLNASAQIPFGPRSPWLLQVNATNLLNLDYYYYLGYLEVREAFPGQPIQVGATLRYRWQ
jgi:iron complex outermembrane receptor protein